MGSVVYKAFSDELLKIASVADPLRVLVIGSGVHRRGKSIVESQDRRIDAARNAGNIRRVKDSLKKLKRRRIRHARKG